MKNVRRLREFLPRITSSGTDPHARRWLGPTRTIQFNDNNWVSVPEAILKEHPRFFALWKDNHILDMPNIPRHVAHVVVHYLNTGDYQSLKLQRLTDMEKSMFDFSSAIYAYCVGLKYNLPILSHLATERIIAYGDKIPFIEIVKRLSNPPFAGMAITGAFREYVCDRMSREGKSMSEQSIVNLKKAMGGTMAGLLCERILHLEMNKNKPT
ncbi:hypothetical protein ACHAPQ_011054 [Fusarium lateritium]